MIALWRQFSSRNEATRLGPIPSRQGRIVKIVGLTVAAVCFAVVLGSAGGRLRLRILGDYVTGDLDAVGIRELWSIIRPRGDYYASIPVLVSSRSAYLALKLPARYAHDSAAGEAVFMVQCAECHSAQQAQHDAPTLTSPDLAHGSSDWAIFRNIRYGLPGTAMRAHPLSTEDIWRVVAYIRGIQHTAASETQRSAVKFSAPPPTTDSILLHATQDPSGWLSYSGDYTGQRLRDLPELRASALGRLRLAWMYQMTEDPQISELTPLVVGQEMLVASAEDITALDLVTGEVRWQRHRPLPGDLRICCSRARRGLAVAGNQVFAGTLDARLLALNLETGAVNWDVAVDPGQAGVSITGPPLVVADRVIVGIAGGEFGVRGFLDAFDPTTGRRLWRFHTILDPGATQSEWSLRAAQHGGGSTWLTGSYDPKLGLLYWGVGNPSPPFQGDARPGDNLYTNSVVALDVTNGRLRWSYQFTPHDTHDWDAAQIPVLVDAMRQGKPRHLLLSANRNGFFYVLDRETGEFLSATAFVRQTWNEGFDAQGRPRSRAAAVPTARGTAVYPGVTGGTNWWSPSADSALGLFFVEQQDAGSLFYSGRQLTGDGGMTLGGWSEPLPGEAPQFGIAALRIADGSIAWRDELPPETSPVMGGLLALRSGMLLAAYSGTLFALDSHSGEELWSLRLGVSIGAAPIAFRAGGHTYLVVVAGSRVFTCVIDTMRPARRPHPIVAARVPRQAKSPGVLGRGDHSYFVRKST